ncbi:MAG: sulfatase, partial [Candidatus Saccharicenans sp.]
MEKQKLNKILPLIFLILIISFLVGLIIACREICFQEYLAQEMYDLALFVATNHLNKAVFIGLILSLSLLLILLIWWGILSRILKIRIETNQKIILIGFRYFIIGLAFLVPIAGIIYFIKSKSSSGSQIFLIVILISLLLILLFLKLKDRQARQLYDSLKKSFKFIFKATGWLFLFSFIVSNLYNLYCQYHKVPEGPNVIIIISDALRPDHLGCYGYNKPTSPNIDKFASESLVFEKAWTTASWTKPAMASLFASMYPHEHRAYYWSSVLANKILTIAEIFKNFGYVTLGVQTNPVLAKDYGFGQGFDQYDQMNFARAEEATAQLIKRMKLYKNKRFFSYIHYYDTHSPYNAPEQYGYKFGAKAGQLFRAGDFKTIDVRILSLMGISKEDKDGLVGLYDGAINYVDENFKKIIDMLGELNIMKNTIIVFTSDHGEEFFEHGNYDHGHSLHEEILRIPLIIGYPGHINGQRISSKVQLVDLLPMIIKLSGLKISSPFFRGFDLT